MDNLVLAIALLCQNGYQAGNKAVEQKKCAAVVLECLNKKVYISDSPSGIILTALIKCLKGD